MKFVLNLLTLQTLPGLQQIQKSPHPNSHPLKNKCRALAVWHFFINEKKFQKKSIISIISIIGNSALSIFYNIVPGMYQ